MLYRVADEIRQGLREPLAVPVAPQVAIWVDRDGACGIHDAHLGLDRAEWLLAMVPPFLDAPTPEAEPSAGGGA